MLQQLAITSGASQAEVLSDCWNFSDSFFFFFLNIAGPNAKYLSLKIMHTWIFLCVYLLPIVLCGGASIVQIPRDSNHAKQSHSAPWTAALKVCQSENGGPNPQRMNCSR